MSNIERSSSLPARLTTSTDSPALPLERPPVGQPAFVAPPQEAPGAGGRAALTSPVASPHTPAPGLPAPRNAGVGMRQPAPARGALVRDPDGVNFTMTVGRQAYRISFHPQAPTQADLDEVSQVMHKLMAVAHDVAHKRGLSPDRITFAEGRAQLFGRLPDGSAGEIHLSRERDEGHPKQVEMVERGLDELRRIFAGRIRFSAEPIAAAGQKPAKTR